MSWSYLANQLHDDGVRLVRLWVGHDASDPGIVPFGDLVEGVEQRAEPRVP